MLPDKKTYEELIVEAAALQKRGRWSEADCKWAEAAVMRRRPPAAALVSAPGVQEETTEYEQELARQERVRARQAGLEYGAVVEHRRRWTDEVLASCTYVADRYWLYEGVKYSSPSSAAKAAVTKLGMKNTEPNGWTFWRIEKREDDNKKHRHVREDDGSDDE